MRLVFPAEKTLSARGGGRWLFMRAQPYTSSTQGFSSANVWDIKVWKSGKGVGRGRLRNPSTLFFGFYTTIIISSRTIGMESGKGVGRVRLG